jgi:DNA-binding CsgD family transcriptional regulator/tetratricopeptide (TPR) repeat protein
VLNGMRRALAQSQGAAILISGEAGVGKSRLLAEFLRVAGEGRTRNIATAESLEVARRPFGPVRDWVSALLPRSRAEQSSAVRRALAAMASEHTADAKPGAFEKSDLFAALATFFRGLADERATILSLEDLQWADASTLEFVAFLARRLRGSRLMLVATYRSEELEANAALAANIARILRAPGARRIALEALSPPEVRELIERGLDGHQPIGRREIDDIARRCEGNPFFAEELLKSALERSVARGDSGLPFSIRAGILERLASLTEAERRIVSGAAVLGYRFDPHALAAIADCDLDTILSALRNARNLNLIVDDDAPLTPFRFRHALTQQTIYADVMPFDARRTHQRILKLFESMDDANAHLEQLAYHAWCARDAAKTLTYNERAGEIALGLYSVADARECFERALSVATDPCVEARLLERVGAIAVMQGRSSDALEAYETALRIRRSRAEFDEAADDVRAIVTERNNAGAENPIEFGEAFLTEFGDRVGAPAHDRLLALMARLSTSRYKFDDATAYLSRLIAPEELSPRALQNRLIAESELYLYAGQTSAWKRVAQRLSDVASELPGFLAAIVLYTVVQAGTIVGANAIVETALGKLERLERRWDFDGLVTFGNATRAHYWYQRGRLDEARAYIERASNLEETTIGRMILASVGIFVALELDDRELGTRWFDEPERSMAETPTPDDTPALAARAMWMAVHDRAHEARAVARRALGSLQRPAPFAGYALVAAAQLLDAPELAQYAVLFDAALLAQDDTAGRANVLLASAIRERRFGDAVAATERARGAAQLYRELGWPLFEARALETSGDAASALALYEASGAVAAVRRLSRSVSAGSSKLSTRESAVAELIASGLANLAIADRLCISTKTVEKHVASIFAKLGVHSRTQVAAQFARGDVGRDAS